MGVATSAHVQVRGKEDPYFCTPIGAPGPGPHVSVKHLLVQAQNGARACVAETNFHDLLVSCASPRFALVRDAGVMREMAAACLRHLIVNSKEVSRIFPIKNRNSQGRYSSSKWTWAVACMAPHPMIRGGKQSPHLSLCL